MASVLGLESVLGKLDALGDIARVDRDMQESLEEAGQIIYEAAKSKCQSTEVSDAIQEPVKDEESKRPAVVVRVEHERAAVEEFGTGPRAGAQGPHNFPARPFMRPAADENKPKVLNSIIKGLESKFNA